jgi:hypothetical protein
LARYRAQTRERRCVTISPCSPRPRYLSRRRLGEGGSEATLHSGGQIRVYSCPFAVPFRGYSCLRSFCSVCCPSDFWPGRATRFLTLGNALAAPLRRIRQRLDEVDFLGTKKGHPSACQSHKPGPAVLKRGMPSLGGPVGLAVFQLGSCCAMNLTGRKSQRFYKTNHFSRQNDQIFGARFSERCTLQPNYEKNNLRSDYSWGFVPGC